MAKKKVTPEQVEAAERQLKELQRQVEYDTKDYCLLLWFLFLVICKYSFQKSTVVIILLNGFQNRTELRIIRHLCQLIVEHRAETSSHIFPCYILVPKISG